VYVASPGKYRLASEQAGLCANLDLSESNAFSDEIFLARGWHPIVLTAPIVRELPELRLVAPNATTVLNRWQMFGHLPEPMGFEATFSEAPDAPAISYDYLTTFDRNWAAYPPTPGTGFYQELHGRLELPKSGQYAFGWLVAGPTQILIDGEVVGSTDSPKPIEFWIQARQFSEGTHEILVKHHATALVTTWARIIPPGEPAQVLDLRYISPP
jgi:hypothetical protein